MYLIIAAIFLIASLHLKDVVEKMLHKELTCSNCEYQVKSLMRYGSRVSIISASTRNTCINI